MLETLPRHTVALNGICPYFTMFPLEFPYSVLARNARPDEWVLDPFCGRGTTDFAARIVGLPSVGVDSNPVAVALAQAKLAVAAPAEIVQAAREILEETTEPRDLPSGRFWELAYHRDVLAELCRLREGLLADCESAPRQALRAILLGALHGPRPKTRSATYFSNQAPRTYAPKPGYAAKFWEERGLVPPHVDVLDIVRERSERYYAAAPPASKGEIILGDSRIESTLLKAKGASRFAWVITSPPYYGMRTYLPDQWLRWWFLGGPPTVDYSTDSQLEHRSPDRFASQLAQVWRNVAAVCRPEATLVVRFGAINDRRIDPIALLTGSIEDAGWQILRVESAGVASAGKRQALHFARTKTKPLDEYDLWATLPG